jgi:hypothetical protein
MRLKAADCVHVVHCGVCCCCVCWVLHATPQVVHGDGGESCKVLLLLLLGDEVGYESSCAVSGERILLRVRMPVWHVEIVGWCHSRSGRCRSWS